MKKITREVFIASDDQEFETAEDAMQHEIVIALQDFDGSSIYIETYQAERIAKALLAKLNITEIEQDFKIQAGPISLSFGTAPTGKLDLNIETDGC